MTGSVDKPGIYTEIRDYLHLTLGLDVTVFFLAGFTKQHLKLYAKQQDESLRSQFVADMSLFTAGIMIFLNETGTDRRDSMRVKAYSLGGKQKQTLLFR